MLSIEEEQTRQGHTLTYSYTMFYMYDILTGLDFF